MLGIVVILNIFFTVFVLTVLPEPQFEAYCPNSQAAQPTNPASCDARGGTWVNDQATVGGPTKAAGFCDMYTKCQKPYHAAQDQHALYAFVIMIGLGLLALIVGLMPTGSSIVSSGLSYGGVLAFIIGSTWYWSSAQNLIRLLISGVGLLALLYIGARRFRD